MIKIYKHIIEQEVGIGICASDDDYGYNKSQITMIRGGSVDGLVSINAAFYIETADFTGGTYFQLGTISEDLVKPNGYVTFAGPEIVQGSLFSDSTGTAFGGTVELDKCVYLVNASGEIFVWVDTVVTSATLSSTDYLIFPIVVTFTKLIEESIVVAP